MAFQAQSSFEWFTQTVVIFLQQSHVSQ